MKAEKSSYAANGNWLAGQLAHRQLSGVGRDRRAREPGNLLIRDTHRVGQIVRQRAQPRAEHQPQHRLAADALPQKAGGLLILCACECHLRSPSPPGGSQRLAAKRNDFCPPVRKRQKGKNRSSAYSSVLVSSVGCSSAAILWPQRGQNAASSAMIARQAGQWVAFL